MFIPFSPDISEPVIHPGQEEGQLGQDGEEGQGQGQLLATREDAVLPAEQLAGAGEGVVEAVEPGVEGAQEEAQPPQVGLQARGGQIGVKRLILLSEIHNLAR